MRARNTGKNKGEIKGGDERRWIMEGHVLKKRERGGRIRRNRGS